MQNQPINFRNLLVSTGIAAAANSAVFAIGGLVGATWDVGQPFNVGIGMVLGASIVPFLIAGLVARAASNKWPALRSWFVWGGFGFALVSAPGGLLASTDLATGLALSIMHIVVGISWLLATKPATK